MMRRGVEQNAQSLPSEQWALLLGMPFCNRLLWGAEPAYVCSY